MIVVAETPIAVAVIVVVVSFRTDRWPCPSPGLLSLRELSTSGKSESSRSETRTTSDVLSCFSDSLCAAAEAAAAADCPTFRKFSVELSLLFLREERRVKKFILKSPENRSRHRRNKTADCKRVIRGHE